MVFSSPWFLAFLGAVLGLLALPIPNNAKKRILSVASCFFYAAWDYRYVALLLGVSGMDYLCATRIRGSSAPRGRRAWLLLSMISNLGLLCYFKYCNFFIDNLNGLLRGVAPQIPHLDILLPAGISFYTFKTMSYVIDTYRGEVAPSRSLLDYIMFVTFFPELIAGPIVRASVFLPQMDRSIGPSRERLGVGGSAFLLGMTKKLLASRLGIMVTPVFATPGQFSAFTLWAATIGYALQIYCDFSGYSDMAIGTAKMIGYDLPENFRMPYLSQSVTEFWRRWHMTLSFWLRDYLYVPLGGNRKGAARTQLNLLITMVLGGLWHGASWNFVLWGALHGVALVGHRWLSRRKNARVWPPAIGIVLTFLFVTLCWVPFRCTTFAATGAMLRGLFGCGPGHEVWVSPELGWIVAVVVCGHVIGSWLARADQDPVLGSLVSRALRWFGAEIARNEVSGSFVRLRIQSGTGTYLVATWILLVFLFLKASNTPFIYFQF